MKNDTVISLGFHETTEMQALVNLKSKELRFRELSWICETARALSKDDAEAEAIERKAFEEIKKLAGLE